MFRPKIIGFVCTWSMPQEIETRSPQAMEGRPKMHLVRVMCVGRIDPVIILDTFARGADGVLLIGCPTPDCHYVTGNIQAENKVKVVKKILALTGVNADRLRLELVSATDLEPFSIVVDVFRNHIITLGPSPLAGESPDEKILLNVLAAKEAAADSRLRVMTGREEELTEAMNVYGERIRQGEFDEILDEIVNKEFLRQKIRLLTSQKPLSVRDIAVETNATPAVVLRQIVDMRRKRMIALDHIEATTPLYKALEV
jgi:F420-non-reducing hydrogenase iron-sulfur subunit